MTDSLKMYFARHHKLLVGAMLAVMLLALLAAPLSIADYGAIAEKHGGDAVRHLKATGFPRATDQPVEEYQFISDGEHATFRVDWQGTNVTLVDKPQGDADVVVKLPAGTYDEVVARFRAVQAGQVITPSEKLSVARDILFRSDVDIDGKGAVGVGLWKTRLSVWATTIVLRGADGLQVV